MHMRATHSVLVAALVLVTGLFAAEETASAKTSKCAECPEAKKAKCAECPEARKSQCPICKEHAGCKEKTQCGDCKSTAKAVTADCAACPADAAVKTAAQAAQAARDEAIAKRAREERIETTILRLSTSAYRDAASELVGYGKLAIPHLIEAMGCKKTPPAAYNLGGHVKADAGRFSRQRTLAEICAEVLTEMISTRTAFKGELPTVDQRAWQTWWSVNADTVTFGQ